MLINEWRGDKIDIESARDVIGHIKNELNQNDRMILKSTYATLCELLLNIKHHAYPEQHGTPCHPWRIQLTKNDKNLLSIVVEDNGISIPVSILHKITPIATDENDTQYSDSHLINEAIYPQIQHTSNGRGQGLKSILNEIDRCLISVFISSRNGEFIYPFNSKHLYTPPSSTSNGTRVEVIISEVKK